MGTFARMLIGVFCLIMISIFVLILLMSFFKRNYWSIFYALFVLTVIISCFPQIRDTLKGETLSEADLQQAFWWIFFMAFVYEIFNCLVLCSHSNYMGAFVAVLVAMLLLKLALPYKRRAFYRHGISSFSPVIDRRDG